MAGEQSKNYEVIYDMGSGLVIAKVNIDFNARIMKNEMQDQLTQNIKKRGQLESLPFLVLSNGRLEIVSGHHRIKSARAAGIKELIAIIDVSGLTRSQIAAKQLAHNAIAGFDDESTLREICKMITDVDDMLESYIGKEIMEEPLEQYEKLASPAVHFDFKNVTFAFLPHQIADMDVLVKALQGSEIVGVASYDDCQRFVETIGKYQQFTDIRNVGAAVHSMIENANERMNAVGFNEDEEWTYLTKLFGSNAIPADAADTIKSAIKKAEKAGIVSSKNRWELIERLCEDYLNESR